MNITRANIEPYLDTAIPGSSYTKVDAWLAAISAQLTSRFGATLPAAIAPAVYDIVANAIARRLIRGRNGAGDGAIKKQSTGPSSVEYNVGVTSLTGWFYPGELWDLGELFGNGGGLSSIRTPAPDAIRYGNLAHNHPLDDDLDTEIGEGDTPVDDGDFELVPDPDNPGYYLP